MPGAFLEKYFLSFFIVFYLSLSLFDIHSFLKDFFLMVVKYKEHKTSPEAACLGKGETLGKSAAEVATLLQPGKWGPLLKGRFLCPSPLPCSSLLGNILIVEETDAYREQMTCLNVTQPVHHKASSKTKVSDRGKTPFLILWNSLLASFCWG